MLSLVTGTVNRPDSFRNLVRSIAEHTTVPWELVVSDASDEPVTCELENVRILPERPRLGNVKGYNRAFRAALGEWVIYLNDDAEVMPGYDVAAIQFMEKQPKIGLGALHYSDRGGPYHVNSAWGCIYANFGILRRSLGDKVGWFDEDLTMYGNDNSLTLRVLLARYGVADIPNAKILHHSVQDKVRIENQKLRAQDSHRLSSKYMSDKHVWQYVFNQHRIDSGHEPWAHGVAPSEFRTALDALQKQGRRRPSAEEVLRRIAKA